MGLIPTMGRSGANPPSGPGSWWALLAGPGCLGIVLLTAGLTYLYGKHTHRIDETIRKALQEKDYLRRAEKLAITCHSKDKLILLCIPVAIKEDDLHTRYEWQSPGAEKFTSKSKEIERYKLYEGDPFNLQYNVKVEKFVRAFNKKMLELIGQPATNEHQ